MFKPHRDLAISSSAEIDDILVSMLILNYKQILSNLLTKHPAQDLSLPHHKQQK